MGFVAFRYKGSRSDGDDGDAVDIMETGAVMSSTSYGVGWELTATRLMGQEDQKRPKHLISVMGLMVLLKEYLFLQVQVGLED